MNIRRGFVGLTALFGIALFAVACSGGDSGGTPAPGSSGGGGSVQADLRLMGGEPLTLDPALAMDSTSATYVQEIFSGLVSLDQNLQLVPDIAESWTVSPDGLTYTFKIRRDAMFHDGRPVTADDFKYSIERTAKLGADGVSTTADAYLGDIVGARDMIRGRANSISGLKVVDSSTLQITIDAPKPYFLAKLTYPTAFVVDKQQVEANPRNWVRKPNATGPYKVSRWDLNERMLLEANDRFYLGAPSVKRVLFNLAGGSSLTQYENDEIDVSGISVVDIERVASPRDPLNAEYKSGPNLSISYIGFNTKSPPFDDPKVRQAFSMAIDREQIVRVVLKNMLPLANSLMMPGLPGYNANAKGPQFNPEMAKQLIAESKYKTVAGLGQIRFSEVGAGASAGLDTQVIVEQWKQNLGVDVNISQSDSASFFDDLDRGRFQMFAIGWIMDYPDPENIIDLHFYSASRQNNTGYSNPEVDSIVLQARTEADTTKRLQLYQQAEQIILNDAPWIPLYYGKDHMVVKPYVKNYGPMLTTIPHLRYITIEK